MAEDIVVGLRERDPRRTELNMDTKYAGRCISCSCAVYVLPSAFDVLTRDDCDPVLICSFCDDKYPDGWLRYLGQG